MPKKKAASPPVQISGYQRPATYRWFEYVEYPDLAEGQEPLKVRVRSNLSFEELDAIPVSAGTQYADAFAAIAPYVVEWNVLRVAAETGELVAVPPPAEVGADIFQVLDHLEANWVIDKVKFGYLAIAKDAEEAAAKMRQFIADAKERASRRSATTDEPSRGSDAETAA